MRIGQTGIRRLPVHQVESILKQIGIGVSSYGTTMMKRSAPKVILWTAITDCSGDECHLPIGNLTRDLAQQGSGYR
jgi:hypothetical protein